MTPEREALAAAEVASKRWKGTPLENPGGGGNDGGMEARIKTLEEAVVGMRSDIAVLKATAATKEDLHKAMSEQTGRVIGAMVGLAAIFGGIVAIAKLFGGG